MASLRSPPCTRSVLTAITFTRLTELAFFISSFRTLFRRLSLWEMRSSLRLYPLKGSLDYLPYRQLFNARRRA